jgi:hypothetical protein
VVGVEVGVEYAGGGDASEGAVTGAFRSPFGLGLLLFLGHALC